MFKIIWKECKMMVVLLFTVVAFVVMMFVNEACGTYETVGEVYTESFTYCTQYAGSGGTHHCSQWKSGTERRINTKVHGYFFETTGYKVVN